MKTSVFSLVFFLALSGCGNMPTRPPAEAWTKPFKNYPCDPAFGDCMRNHPEVWSADGSQPHNGYLPPVR